MKGNTMKHMFSSTLVRPEGTGTWTYAPIPSSVTKALATAGRKGRIPVKAEVDGVALAGSLMPDGDGGHYLVVKKEARDKAGKNAGDKVMIELAVDDAKRTVEVPEALKKALQRDEAAREAFDALAYSHQKEYAAWIDEAKKDETKVARADKALAMLKEGRRLKG